MLFIHQTPPAAVLGKPWRREPDEMGDGGSTRQTPRTHPLQSKASTRRPMPKPSSPPMPSSCQSCTFREMQRNGPLDPGFRIPGAPRFLRGWSVSVDGCPLAERRATTHPPGSLTPKERASNLREQCSLGGVGGRHPASRLCARRGGLTLLQPGSVLPEGLPMLYVAETRSQLSGLSGASPTTARLSSPRLQFHS